jgi:hypothetical protein
MSENILRFFRLKGEGSFEDYCAMIDGLLNLPDDKMQYIVFKAFDVDRDGYICNHDAFQALS